MCTGRSNNLSALEQAASVMSQTTRDFVPISEQYRLFVPFPPLAEQYEIVRTVKSLLVRSSSMARAMDEAVRQVVVVQSAILAKAFRGELVPQDPNDEPASVFLERMRAEREARSTGKKKLTASKRQAAE